MAVKIIRTQSKFYSLHTHSKFSAKDALPSVKDLVAEAKRLGYPGLGLTDHGNMAGSIQLYRECRAAGIKPFPGSELYVVHDRSDKKAKRHHLGVVAFTSQGYRNLVKLSTTSHLNFYNKPLLDFADLAELSELGHTQGIALLTGCFFGFPIQKLVNEGEAQAKAMLATYARWFDATYVELQDHGIDHEGYTDIDIANQLKGIADELGLPVVLTADAHYAKQEDKPAHESLKRLVAFGPDPDDATFPGDSFHLCSDGWIGAHFDPVLRKAGFDGLQDLAIRHDLGIPECDNYHYRVPTRDADPESSLDGRVRRALLDRGLDRPAYRERLEEELDVIRVSRMAGYLLMTTEVCDHMREVEMFYQCRGSAAGSLVCWLLDITNVDPIKWKLRFDRFLSKDRTKPPDIDIDIEHDRRGELIEWLNGRYTVSQIGTWMTFSMSGEEDGKGSLRVQYLSRKRASGQDANWKSVTPEERKQLADLDMRKLYSGYGVHAAGLILCQTRSELEDMVPQMYVASSKTMVSQYAMKDIESIGLVKLDVLGVKTLTVLRKAILNMNRSPREGLDFIPLNDRATYRTIAAGNTEGVFQLEGATASRGVRQLRPDRITDVIAAMALYRPATMGSGATDSYVRRKHGDESVPARNQLINQATKDTHGILLYQDQVITILRALGMTADDLTQFLKAVKSSNDNVEWAKGVIDHYRPLIVQMCQAKEFGEDDISWLWKSLESFAEYGFNQSHATVYGLTAFHCAYLATHHPVEFFAALLSVASGGDKEAPYIAAARKRGVKIKSPDVNISMEGYTVDTRSRAIRKGLLSVKGIGPSAVKDIIEHRTYSSIRDFASKVTPRMVSGTKDYLAREEFSGKIAILNDAGCFRSIE